MREKHWVRLEAREHVFCRAECEGFVKRCPQAGPWQTVGFGPVGLGRWAERREGTPARPKGEKIPSGGLTEPRSKSPKFQAWALPTTKGSQGRFGKQAPWLLVTDADEYHRGNLAQVKYIYLVCSQSHTGSNHIKPSPQTFWLVSHCLEAVLGSNPSISPAAPGIHLCSKHAPHPKAAP